MKKFVIATTLALTAAASFAGDFSVSASDVYKHKGDVNAARVGATGYGFEANVTADPKLTEIAVGKEFTVAEFGPVNFSLVGEGVYQRSTLTERDTGYGIRAGAKVNYPLTKQLTLSVGAERYAAEHRLRQFDANTAIAGVSYKF